MDSLRWILLAFGVLVLGAIYYFGSRAEKRRSLGLGSAAPAGRGRIDPTLDLADTGSATVARRSSAEVDDDLATLSDLVADHRRGPSQAEPDPEPEVDLTVPTPPPVEDDDPRPDVQMATHYDQIVSLIIRAKSGRHISGIALANSAEKAGLIFGRLSIYHRLLEKSEGNKELIFSMVNVEKPGTFSNDPLDNFTTPGVNLFMTLPGPLSALDTWDSMLTTGQRLAELLDAELLDDTQSHLTRQTIAHAREQMREFDRQHNYAT